MQGKVLLVEHRMTDRILLRSCLSDACYDVAQAFSGADALSRMHEGPDAVILAADLPGTDCARFCAALCGATHPLHVPIIVLTTDNPGSRAQLIAAGADEVLDKSVPHEELLARLRGLLRRNGADREWRFPMADGTTGLAPGFGEGPPDFQGPGVIKLLSDAPELSETLLSALDGAVPFAIAPEPLGGALARLHSASGSEIFVLAPSDAEALKNALELLADLTARPATRDSTKIVLLPKGADRFVADCVDKGADDAIQMPAEADEIALRLLREATRHADRARARHLLRNGLQASVLDPLTGLHNRRFAMPRLARIVERALQSGHPFAVLMADIDHFKSVNDRFGHATGDAVLVEVARRLQGQLGPQDLIARIGGEEFLIVLPDTGPAQTDRLARALCAKVSERPAALTRTGEPVHVTLSIGASTARVVPGGLDVETLIGAADRALYASKAAGRNTVTLRELAA